MLLRDLLDMLRRDILRDTSDQVAGDSDQLWSDSSLIRFIDQAQRRFARRTLCIRDAASPVTRFVTVSDQAAYTLDPSVIAILSMRFQGNGVWVGGAFLPGSFSSDGKTFTLSGLAPIYPDSADLVRTAHANRGSNRGLVNDLPFDVNYSTMLRSGRPRAFDTDESLAEVGGSSGVVVATLFPGPDVANAGCVMQMRVCRMPLARLTPSTMDDAPEIPEDYHVDMLDYAAYLALRIVDHEAGDAARAQEFQASFDRHVEEARTEIQRKSFAPQAWGFGGGFSYTPN